MNMVPKHLGALVSSLVLTAVCSAVQADTSSDMIKLGKSLFSSTALSKPQGQACASCHDPKTGFTSPLSKINAKGAVIHGAIERRAGNRKPPTTAYVTYAAKFAFVSGRPSGGTFWDGRATGTFVGADIFPTHWDATTLTAMTLLLGPATDQAMGPLLNDVEQNLDDTQQLCQRAKDSVTPKQWQDVWGEKLKCQDVTTLDTTHKRIAFAIAAFENSTEVSPFNAKWDNAISAEIAAQGSVTFPLDTLTPQENAGHQIYVAQCGRFCHAGTVTPNGITKELFTRPNAGYFNIGAPKNDQNPFYKMDTVKNDADQFINPLGGAWVDLGLAGRGTEFLGQEGKMKVPTLRNVAKKPNAKFIKAYTHNGYFKSLKSLVHFYNTRDLKPVCEQVLNLPFDPQNPLVLSDGEAMLMNCWPEAEVNLGLFACSGTGTNCKVNLAPGETFETYCDNAANIRDVGNLCLSSSDEDALVSFLGTLSDNP